jgi:hypothetical protein
VGREVGMYKKGREINKEGRGEKVREEEELGKEEDQDHWEDRMKIG